MSPVPAVLDFKSARVHDEWMSMVHGRKPDGLLPVMLYAGYQSMLICGEPAVVTMIWRSDDEQAELLHLRNQQREEVGLAPVSMDTKSVHQLWRGFDLRSRIYTVRQRQELCRRVSTRFDYGRGRKTLAYHPRGTAGHLHGQIPGLEPWRQ